MLHIILGILKIIGILLGILLGICLLLIICVLFVPICYKGTFDKEKKDLAAKGCVSWLFHLLSGTISYEGNQTQLKIKILGITLEQYKKFFEHFRWKRQVKPKHKKQTVSEPVKQELLASESPVSSTNGQTVTQALMPEQTSSNGQITAVGAHNKRVYSRIRNIFHDILQIPKRIWQFIQKLIGITRKILTNIKIFLHFITSEEYKQAKKLLFSQAARLLKHMRPQKWRGSLTYGFTDPALTGQLLAGFSMCYPLYRDHIQIQPYFDREILEGHMKLNGRVYGFVLLQIGWKLYRDSNIRYIIKQFQH